MNIDFNVNFFDDSTSQSDNLDDDEAQATGTCVNMLCNNINNTVQRSIA